MKKDKMISILDNIEAMYPTHRTANQKQYWDAHGFKDRFNLGDRCKSVRTNYLTLKDCDFTRVWLYCDLSLYSPKVSKLSAWFQWYLSYDFSYFDSALNWVYEWIRRENPYDWSIQRLKTEFRNAGYSDISLRLLLEPLWPRFEYFLINCKRSNECPANETGTSPLTSDWIDFVRRAVQWLRVDSKCILDDPDLEEAAYEKFYTNDQRLKEHWAVADPQRDAYCKAIRDILSSWINDAEFQLDSGRHGSGATSIPETGRDISLKTNYLGYTDEKLEYLKKKHPGVDFFGSPEFCGMHTAKGFPRGMCSRVARQMSVPKNLKTKRGIGPQSPTLMWYQQATLDTFYRVVWSKPFIREHFSIFDRSVNRAAALAGSLSNDMATMDLSSASDSVSLHLVKRVFKTNVRTALLCCRSVCFDKRPNHMFETYATMGDASTFPVETLIFGACVQLSLNLAKAYYSERNSKITWNPRKWSVFGDDICLPNDRIVIRYLLDILKRLGFLVNEDKSFITGPYRESCGLEGYLGASIEPFYARLKIEKTSRYGSLVSAANSCYNRGLKSLRQWYLYLLSHLCGGYNKIPWTELDSDSSSVQTPFIDVTRLIVSTRDRKGNKCQITTVKAVRCKSRTAEAPAIPEYAEWYGYYCNRRSAEREQQPVEDFLTSLNISEPLSLDFSKRKIQLVFAPRPLIELLS